MILALLVAGNVVVRVAPVPAELVLLVGGHVDVLEVAVGLLAVAALPLLRLLGVGEGRDDGDQQK